MEEMSRRSRWTVLCMAFVFLSLEAPIVQGANNGGNKPPPPRYPSPSPPPPPPPRRPPSPPPPSPPPPRRPPSPPPPSPPPPRRPPSPPPPSPPPPRHPSPPPPSPRHKSPPPPSRRPPPPRHPSPPPPSPRHKSPPPPPPSRRPPPPPPPSPPPPRHPSPPPPSPRPKSPPPPPPPKDKVTDYFLLSPLNRTGQARAFCQALGPCFWKILTCPPQCPERKPRRNRRVKGCFINCSNKCEATCRWRKPRCNGFGSLCYDPRFVGGDGVMFYFHGAKGGDFAIVSDDNLQINAHFIGTRAKGRTRDYTWVQALSVMFDTHTLVLAAERISKWDDKVDALILKWDDQIINVPTDGEAEWKINTENNKVVTVERTDDLNMVRVTVSGLLEMDVRVTPIGEQENKAHNYQIPADDAFAHLETQFKFFKLSESVEGVLGKTYQPGYVSPVKIGVPMPMMGGEDKYQTPSINSPICKLCRFQRPSMVASI